MNTIMVVSINFDNLKTVLALILVILLLPYIIFALADFFQRFTPSEEDSEKPNREPTPK